MMEPTIGTAIAVAIGTAGVAAFVNGVKHGFLSDAALGGLMVVLGYWITTLGYVL